MRNVAPTQRRRSNLIPPSAPAAQVAGLPGMFEGANSQRFAKAPGEGIFTRRLPERKPQPAAVSGRFQPGLPGFARPDEDLDPAPISSKQ